MKETFCEICEESKVESKLCTECGRRVCINCYDTNSCIECTNGVDEDE